MGITAPPASVEAPSLVLSLYCSEQQSGLLICTADFIIHSFIYIFFSLIPLDDHYVAHFPAACTPFNGRCASAAASPWQQNDAWWFLLKALKIILSQKPDSRWLEN